MSEESAAQYAVRALQDWAAAGLTMEPRVLRQLADEIQAIADRIPAEQAAREAVEERSTCAECGRPLLLRNVGVADGCPCNAPRGINHGRVPRDVCTCEECDPKRSGSSRCHVDDEHRIRVHDAEEPEPADDDTIEVMLTEEECHALSDLFHGYDPDEPSSEAAIDKIKSALIAHRRSRKRRRAERLARASLKADGCIWARLSNSVKECAIGRAERVLANLDEEGWE